MGGDVGINLSSVRIYLFQSTPPHGGRLDNLVSHLLLNQVSIHAPAWGATKGRENLKKRWKVSIHAPAWGATGLYYADRLRKSVSIHAPAWGATSRCSADIPFLLFQSTPPHGGRRDTWPTTTLSPEFQSTPPHGGRQIGAGDRDGMISFNPRPRMGGD